MNKLKLIAWKNLQRKKGRTFLLILNAALTVFILFSAYFLLQASNNSAQITLSRLGADIIVVPKGMGQMAGETLISGFASPNYVQLEIMHELEKMPQVEKVSPQLYLETISTICCGTEGDFPIVAFDPQLDFTLAPWMVKDTPLDQQEIVIGTKAGGRNYMFHHNREEVIEWVNLFGETFVVRDVLFPTGTVADESIFMRLDAAQQLIRKSPYLHIPEQVASVLFVQTLPGTAQFVMQSLEYLYGSEIDVLAGKQMKERIGHQLLPLRLLSYFIICLVLLMSLFQVLTLFSAIVSERQKEIGILRALGASKRRTYQLFLLEASYVSLFGGMLGASLAAALLYDHRTLLMQWLHIPLLYPTWLESLASALFSIALTWLISLLGAFFPIRSILSLEPYEAMREGEI